MQVCARTLWCLPLVRSRGIHDVHHWLSASRHYNDNLINVCTGCLIKRHLSLRRWCQQTLKTWHEHSKLSSSSVRWQSDDTRDGKADGNNTGEKSNVESTTAAQEDTRDQAKTVPSEDTSQPTGSTNPEKKRGKVIVSFHHAEGTPVLFQLRRCIDNKTLQVTDELGNPVKVGSDFYMGTQSARKSGKKEERQHDNQIDRARALEEFMLKPRHLEDLPKFKKRSAYHQESFVTMYWKSDLIKKSIEVWGSLEAMRKARAKNMYYRTSKVENSTFLETVLSRSGKVVVAAIVANIINAGVKGTAWMYTSSDSMFAEMNHSIADAANQCFLLYGLHKSNQAADPEHPYGYGNTRHIYSFVAGLGIFFIGGGINIYHGIAGIMCGQSFHYSIWAAVVLICTTITESASLLLAYEAAKERMNQHGKGLLDFIRSGEDPNVAVVLLEDSVAVLGNLVALLFYMLGSHTTHTWLDPLGSLIVGGLLLGVGGMIMNTNFDAIIGKSISLDQREAIISATESDPVVRSVHDAKVVSYGGDIRFKAEVDYNGRRIAQALLDDKQNVAELLEKMQCMSTTEEAEEFLLDFGDKMIERLGVEVDRIEEKIKTKHNVRHVDLESL